MREYFVLPQSFCAKEKELKTAHRSGRRQRSGGAK
jgi:hypothetical protein